MGKISLRRLPPVLRILTAGFLISLGLAYAVALLFVFVRSELKPSGISSQYRGDTEAQTGNRESPEETAADPEDAIPAFKDEWKHRSSGMDYPKSLKEMILTTHLHMLSISVILFLLGGIFAASSFPEKAKGAVIASGFAGLVLTYASMWALRYGSTAFSHGVLLFGIIQAMAMVVQFSASLRDLFSGDHPARSAA